jgi:hypothetical protein
LPSSLSSPSVAIVVVVAIIVVIVVSRRDSRCRRHPSPISLSSYPIAPSPVTLSSAYVGRRQRMHLMTRRRQRRCYSNNSWRQLWTMGSAAPVGGGGGVGRGLRVDAVAAAGGGGGRRRRWGCYLSMSCVALSCEGGEGGSTFVLLAGGIWLLARSRHINFLPLNG